ncbi:MAG TPA: hypothetical protein H9854_04750 [Candidatus Halomonas stercoripullorum]|uniref:Uncharacterized protein n=1 Tax=Candidatus Halomonas stercoripullorum TaxID=2838617 RepID=A0A9D2B5U7_9GAMM|nr:hypothetical protein [Candidatus Halomonas stercoripullorum]
MPIQSADVSGRPGIWQMAAHHFQGTNQTGRSAGIRQQRTPLAGPQLPL